MFEADGWLTAWSIFVVLALISIVVVLGILLWRTISKRRVDSHDINSALPRENRR